jgi:hypothetical protein
MGGVVMIKTVYALVDDDHFLLVNEGLFSVVGVVVHHREVSSRI